METLGFSENQKNANAEEYCAINSDTTKPSYTNQNLNKETKDTEEMLTNAQKDPKNEENGDQLLRVETSTQDTTEEPKKSKLKFILTIIAFLLFVGFILYIYASGKVRIIMGWLIKGIELINSIPEPVRSLIFIVSLIVIQISFIPIQSTFIIAMCFILKDYWKAMAVQIISNLISCTLTYFVVRDCFNKKMHEKYKNLLMYKVVMKESQINPIKINLMLRVMFIPVTIKNTLVALAGMKYLVVILCYLPSILVFNTLYTMIGIHLDTIQEVLNPKDFSKKSFPEKIKVIMGYIIIVLTITFFILMICFTKRKMDQYQKEYGDLDSDEEEDLEYERMFQRGLLEEEEVRMAAPSSGARQVPEIQFEE